MMADSLELIVDLAEQEQQERERKTENDREL
jgi:hypothetical protein